MIPDRFNDKNPKKSAAAILKSSKHVQISTPGVEKLALNLADKVKAEGAFWEKFQHVDHPLSFKSDSVADTAQWLFLIDTANFSYWQDPNPETGEILGVYTVDGYKTTFAQVAAFKRELERSNGRWLNPDYILSLDDAKFEEIYRPDPGHPAIPLLSKRVEHLREVSLTLQRNFDGQIYNLIKLAEGSAVALLNLILEHFPCFRDESPSGEFGFYKRAQLFVCDLVNHCKKLEIETDSESGARFCDFHDLGELSVFADYRNPQSLLAFDCLKYGDELVSDLKAKRLIPLGDRKEQEIRAATIQSCEMIVDRTNILLGEANEPNRVNALIVDNFLWCYAKFHMDESKVLPYHLTRCVWY